MIKTIITPLNNTVQLSIPSKYIGKEIEVLVYSKDELVEENTTKGNAARFKGLLTPEDANKYNQHLNQVRNEWNRDI